MATKKWYACIGTTTGDPTNEFGHITQATNKKAAEKAFTKAAWDAQDLSRSEIRDAKQWGYEPTLQYMFESDTEIREA